MPRNQQIFSTTARRAKPWQATSSWSLPTPCAAGGPGAGAQPLPQPGPYMRGRMNDAKSYAQPQPLGEVMQGGTAGEVVESRSPKLAVGDKVVGFGGWQEYTVVDAMPASPVP